VLGLCAVLHPFSFCWSYILLSLQMLHHQRMGAGVQRALDSMQYGSQHASRGGMVSHNYPGQVVILKPFINSDNIYLTIMYSVFCIMEGFVYPLLFNKDDENNMFTNGKLDS
jgi:hypothetical protein